MKKFIIGIAIAILAIFAVATVNAAESNGGIATYLDYLNSDAIESHPAVFAELDFGESFGVVGGFAANRSETYDFTFGPKLYSNDLYGQILFNTDFDPALRVGVDVDIAETIFGSVGYEWLYDKVEDEFKFTAVDDGKIILSLGLRW